MTEKSTQGHYLEDLYLGMAHEKTMIVDEEKINAFAELSGDYNPTIAKLVLSANHGMAEKQEIEQSGTINLGVVQLPPLLQAKKLETPAIDTTANVKET